MANFKVSRTEEDLFRELTAVLRELKDPRIDPLLSIVRIELSRDLSNCKVYVSSLSGPEKARESAEGLRSAGGYIKREVFRRLKMRKVPSLHFIADDSIAHSAKINEMLHHVQPSVEEEPETSEGEE
ncbi:MAG: 30S ribosome-binding factor RbfA [Ruminococcus sp.]|nr:30S ribosome-binding factor RbfA [Ruminococcus sp.]